MKDKAAPSLTIKTNHSVSVEDLPKSLRESIFRETVEGSDTKTLMRLIPDKTKETIWRMMQMAGACNEIKRQVAFYNMGDQKAFYFVSPQEARMAMDHIESLRKGIYVVSPEEKAQDEFAKKWAEQYCQDHVSLPMWELSGDTNGFSMEWMNRAFSAVESKWDKSTVAAMVMSPANYANVRGWGKTIYDEATCKETLERGLFGHVWTAGIYVDRRMPETDVLFLAMPDEKHPFGGGIRALVPPFVAKPKEPGNDDVLGELKSLKGLLAAFMAPSPKDAGKTIFPDEELRNMVINNLPGHEYIPAAVKAMIISGMPIPLDCGVPAQSPEDRMWAIIREASANIPKFRVRVEIGDIPRATCRKPLLSKAYVIGRQEPSKNSPPEEVIFSTDEILEGEDVFVNKHPIRDNPGFNSRWSHWLGHVEKFVEEMSKLPGGRVLCFYIDHGGVGRYNELSVGACAYDAA